MNTIEWAFIAWVGTEPELLKVSQAGKPWTSPAPASAQLAGNLHKGDKIYAEGRLKLDTWTGKDGKERTRYQGRGVARRAAGPDRQEQARQSEGTTGRRATCTTINGSIIENLPEPESRQGRNALNEATSTCPFYKP